MKATLVLAALLIFTAAASVQAAPIMFSAVAPNAAALTAARDDFRAAIGGGVVAGAAGSFGGVRREINWDAVPDAFSAPNNLPLDFFNVNSPRGAVFSTSGTGVQVSANAGAAPIEFDTINPTYSSTFGVFSAQRLFAPIGSNVMDVSFFLAGTTTPAVTSAFGAIFTDVDLSGSSLELFNAANNSLGTFAVPSLAGSETFSFLGLQFASPVISRVRITTGNAALGAGVNDGGATDVVVMDDFLYAEPVEAPEPASLLLFGSGAIALAVRMRRRGRR